MFQQSVTRTDVALISFSPRLSYFLIFLSPWLLLTSPLASVNQCPPRATLLLKYSRRAVIHTLPIAFLASFQDPLVPLGVKRTLSGTITARIRRSMLLDFFRFSRPAIAVVETS